MELLALMLWSKQRLAGVEAACLPYEIAPSKAMDTTIHLFR